MTTASATTVAQNAQNVVVMELRGNCLNDSGILELILAILCCDALETLALSGNKFSNKQINLFHCITKMRRAESVLNLTNS